MPYSNQNVIIQHSIQSYYIPAVYMYIHNMQLQLVSASDLTLVHFVLSPWQREDRQRRASAATSARNPHSSKNNTLSDDGIWLILPMYTTIFVLSKSLQRSNIYRICLADLHDCCSGTCTADRATLTWYASLGQAMTSCLCWGRKRFNP